MADPSVVAKKDGVFRTDTIKVEAHHVAPGYKLTVLDQNEIDPTGRLKVLRLSPSSEQVADPSIVGRWDGKADALDFDAADRDDNVDKNARFSGHHSKALGDRRFEVEIRTEANTLVFKGVVSVALGFRIHLPVGFTVVGHKIGAVIVQGPDDEFRARIRELMTSGALPSDPPVKQRTGLPSPSGRPPDTCAICLKPDPTVHYFWTGGLVVRLHALCDALWKQERETR